jgi:GNAT superfamily N-acetyltransferase
VTRAADDGRMSTMPVISFDLEVVPLATIGDDAIHRFAARLAAEPRVFGPRAAGRPSGRWCSMLTHPSQPVGVAAMVDDDLVGVARLTRRAAAGRELYVAVAAPMRRLGLGGRLVREAGALAAARGEDVVLVAERPNAPVRSLTERFRLQPVDAVAGFLAFQGRVA